MAGTEGRTLLEVLCFHCALSPRAPRSVVELSGGPGFPLSLWGTCGTCGVVYVARQTGRVIARPLALVTRPRPRRSRRPLQMRNRQGFLCRFSGLLPHSGVASGCFGAVARVGSVKVCATLARPRGCFRAVATLGSVTVCATLARARGVLAQLLQQAP